ncbi:Protein Phosphatase 1 Regulatory Subunit 36 [Manis pentadactyla]|nr:Protein Phosphatase 1 Regulatory Subunit 36 [Manis pentadactyla]
MWWSKLLTGSGHVLWEPDTRRVFGVEEDIRSFQREPGFLARELSRDSEALDSLLEKQRLMNQSYTGS